MKKDDIPFPVHALQKSRFAVAGETVDPPFPAMDRAAAL